MSLISVPEAEVVKEVKVLTEVIPMDHRRSSKVNVIHMQVHMTILLNSDTNHKNS